MRRGFSLALVAATWLWLELLGILLSTLSTRVYFGWKGLPGHGALLAALPVLAFGGPALARALHRRGPGASRVGPWLLASLAACAGVASRPPGDALVALAVGGTLLAGLAMALALAEVASAGAAAAAVLGAVCLDAVGRSMHRGLLAAAGGEWAVLGGLAMLAAAAAVADRRRAPPGRSDPCEDRGTGHPGAALGLVLGLGGTIVWNLPLWSAPWPLARDAGGFLLSFAAGTTVGLVVASRAVRSRRTARVVLAVAALAASLGLAAASSSAPWAVDPLLRLWWHGAACAGLASLLALALMAMSHQSPDRRFADLQWGFLGAVAACSLFMLRATPVGFWVALAASTAILWIRPPVPGLPLALAPRAVVTWAAIALLPLAAVAARPAPPPATVPEAPAILQVLSSNVRYGWTDDDRFDPRVHLQWLAAHPVDLLGLQELSAGSSFAGFQDLRALYAQRLGGHWAFGDANWGFGNALRSAWPIRQVEVRPYTAHALMRRSALWARVDVNGRLLTVVVTHFSHLPAPDPVRAAQARELRDWLAAEPGPWILLGDLNAEPHEPEIRALLELAHPAFLDRPELLRDPTHPSRTPRRRIDYAITSAELEPLDCRALDTRGSSDHRPVLLRARPRD